MARDNPSEILDTVIVGGGIAGLTVGYRLKDRNVLLLEKETQCGGRTISRKWGEYVYNTGAQVILGGKSRVAKLTDELGVRRTLIAKSRLPFYFKGKLVSSSTEMGLLWKLPLPLKEKIKLGLTFYRIKRRFGPLAEKPFDPRDPLTLSLNRCTLEEFIGSCHPDVKALWNILALDSTTGAAHQVTPYFPIMLILALMADEYYVEGGTGKLTEALYSPISSKVETKARVVEISQSDKLVHVTYEKEGSRQTLQARQCVVAVPAPIVREMIQGLPQWKQEALSQVEYGSMTTAAFLLSEPSERFLGKGIWRVPVEGKIFCALTDPSFTLPRELKERVGQGFLRAYTGDAASKELMVMSDGEVIEMVLDDLMSMFPRIKDKVIDTAVTHWKYALPRWKPGHLNILTDLQAPTGNIHYCGDYTDMSFMEGAVSSAYRVVEELQE